MKKQNLVGLIIIFMIIMLLPLVESKYLLSKTEENKELNRDAVCGDIILEDTILTNNLVNCAQNGLTIGANNIELDCNGHFIDGIGSDDYFHGIYVNDKTGVTIKNCNVFEFYNGIYLDYSDNNEISDNILSENIDGISIRYSNDNQIINNEASINYRGIHVWYASNSNEILDNTLFDNGQAIMFQSYSSNMVTENLVSNNDIFDNEQGIFLQGADDNTISNNIISNNYYGIMSWSSEYNSVYANDILQNEIYGIKLFYNSKYNTIWDNDFIDNCYHRNAYEDSSSVENNWDYNNVGNYWDDFSSNPGHPDMYEIYGPGNGVDHYPNRGPNFFIVNNTIPMIR